MQYIIRASDEERPRRRGKKYGFLQIDNASHPGDIRACNTRATDDADRWARCFI